MRHHSHTLPHPRESARSAMTVIGASMGFMLGSAFIVPLQGDSVIGPWAIMALGLILGAIVGYVVGPLFSGLFKADSPLRDHHRVLSGRDPLTGRTLQPASEPGRRVV